MTGPIFADNTAHRMVRRGFWVVEGHKVIRQGPGHWSVYFADELKYEGDNLRQCVRWIEEEENGVVEP